MNSFSPKLWRLRKRRWIGTAKARTAAFRSTMRAKGKTTGTDASNNGKLLEKMINLGCVGKSKTIHMRAFASAAPKSPESKENVRHSTGDDNRKNKRNEKRHALYYSAVPGKCDTHPHHDQPHDIGDASLSDIRVTSVSQNKQGQYYAINVHFKILGG